MKNRRYLVIRHEKYKVMYCCCLRFESIGYPCRHVFAVMKYANMRQIPAACIYKRWAIDAKEKAQEGKGSRPTDDNDETLNLNRVSYLNGFSNNVNRYAARNKEMYEKMRDHYAKILIDIREDEEVKEKTKNPKVKKSIGICDPEIVQGKGNVKKPKRTCGKCHQPGN